MGLGLVRYPRRARSTAGRAGLGAALALSAVSTLELHPAHADHYEVQWSARPFAGVTELHEEGATERRAMVAGFSLGASYGVSNHLDLGAELVAFAAAIPTFKDARLILDGGAEYRGPFVRRTDEALLLVGPTWRFGVTWVPVVSLAAGAGARVRSDGTFTEIGIVPDAARESIGFELAASARVGIEYRAHPRVTVGAYASVLASWGTSAPMLPVASVSLGMSWVHYPGWW
jgi:hypothetical protein